MTTKPIIPEKMLLIILSAFVVAKYEPDAEMLKCLAKATKKSEYEIALRYGDRLAHNAAKGGVTDRL
jgi:hypothetical protein